MIALPDAVHSRPLVGLVVNWEETEEELVFTGSQRAEHECTCSIMQSLLAATS